MRPVFRVPAICAALLLAGCASDGSLKNPFKSEGDQPAATVSTMPVSPNFTGEFTDVPVPKDMDERSGGTFTTSGGSGGKTGIQKFRGRLEVTSLMSSMRSNMAAQGWTLRALLRSDESVLVFEKRDRVCTLVFSDGNIFTDMTVFMASRLEGDSGSLDMSNRSSPKASSRSSGSSGGMSGGKQQLSQ